MDKRARNVLVTPVVLLVRAPVMAILEAVVILGDLAKLGREWVGEHVPGWWR